MVKRRTRSILEEIENMEVKKDREHFVESRANNIIAGAGNLMQLINETYDKDTANDLNKRLMNAIRTQDTKKFERGIKKINESRGHSKRRSSSS